MIGYLVINHGTNTSKWTKKIDLEIHHWTSWSITTQQIWSQMQSISFLSISCWVIVNFIFYKPHNSTWSKLIWSISLLWLNNHWRSRRCTNIYYHSPRNTINVVNDNNWTEIFFPNQCDHIRDTGQLSVSVFFMPKYIHIEFLSFSHKRFSIYVIDLIPFLSRILQSHRK